MNICQLEWDTNFFGYPIGQFQASNDDGIREFDLQTSKFKLISIVLDQKSSLEYLKLVDNKVTLNCQLSNSNNLYELEDSIIEFNPKKHSINELKSLNLESGKFSRYNTDKNFVNSEYTKLYNTWINNTLNGILPGKIKILLKDNELCGFISFSKNNSDAKIQLIAVNKNYRGQGIAGKLLLDMRAECALESINNISVVTQENNIPALKLYEKHGFKVESVKYIYHYWNL